MREHRGNMLNEITFEEHDGDLNAKRVNVVAGTITASSQVTVTLNSTPTLFAVVNTSAAGQSSVVLDRGHQFIGLATVNIGSSNATLFAVVNTAAAGQASVVLDGNVTLSDSKGFIGLTTSVLASAPTLFAVVNTSAAGQASVRIDGNVTLSDSKGYIGLVTSTIGNNPVLGAGVNSIGFVSVTPVQAWPDPKTYIGLVTITGSLSPAAGNITLDPGSLTGIRGNITLSDSKGFIGLVTVGNIVSISFSGNVTLDAGSRTGILGNVTLSDSKGFIGLVTVGNVVSTTFSGNVTLDAGSLVGIRGNLTLSDSKGFIGLTTTTLGASPAFIGLVTVVQSSSARTITGNVTISDSKTFIGLVTAVQAYGSGSTVFSGVISATGNTTVLVAPASNRFFIKNLHVSSLGRSELEVRSGATTLLPFTSLSTTSGFFENYGEMGLPARAQTDALVFNLNGAATISYMANVRFEA